MGLAGRYADALLELAAETGAAESVEADVKRLRDVLADSADLQRFIASPAFSRDAHIAGVGAVLDQVGVSETTRKFVLLVASNRRLFALAAIFDTVLAKLAEARGEVTAAVTSAKELTAKQKDALAKALKTATGREVALDLAVDPKVLGGLVVQIGSRMVDSSLRSQLQRLQLAMKGVG